MELQAESQGSQRCGQAHVTVDTSRILKQVWVLGGMWGPLGLAKQSRLYRSDWKWMSPTRRSTGKQEHPAARVLKAGVMSAEAGGCRQTNITSVP